MSHSAKIVRKNQSEAADKLAKILESNSLNITMTYFVELSFDQKIKNIATQSMTLCILSNCYVKSVDSKEKQSLHHEFVNRAFTFNKMLKHIKKYENEIPDRLFQYLNDIYNFFGAYFNNKSSVDTFMFSVNENREEIILNCRKINSQIDRDFENPNKLIPKNCSVDDDKRNSKKARGRPRASTKDIELDNTIYEAWLKASNSPARLKRNQFVSDHPEWNLTVDKLAKIIDRVKQRKNREIKK